MESPVVHEEDFVDFAKLDAEVVHALLTSLELARDATVVHETLWKLARWATAPRVFSAAALATIHEKLQAYATPSIQFAALRAVYFLCVCDEAALDVVQGCEAWLRYCVDMVLGHTVLQQGSVAVVDAPCSVLNAACFIQDPTFQKLKDMVIAESWLHVSVGEAFIAAAAPAVDWADRLPELPMSAAVGMLALVLMKSPTAAPRPAWVTDAFVAQLAGLLAFPCPSVVLHAAWCVVLIQRRHREVFQTPALLRTVVQYWAGTLALPSSVELLLRLAMHMLRSIGPSNVGRCVAVGMRDMLVSSLLAVVPQEGSGELRTFGALVMLEAIVPVLAGDDTTRVTLGVVQAMFRVLGGPCRDSCYLREALAAGIRILSGVLAWPPGTVDVVCRALALMGVTHAVTNQALQVLRACAFHSPQTVACMVSYPFFDELLDKFYGDDVDSGLCRKDAALFIQACMAMDVQVVVKLTDNFRFERLLHWAATRLASIHTTDRFVENCVLKWMTFIVSREVLPTAAKTRVRAVISNRPSIADSLCIIADAEYPCQSSRLLAWWLLWHFFKSKHADRRAVRRYVWLQSFVAASVVAAHCPVCMHRYNAVRNCAVVPLCGHACCMDCMRQWVIVHGQNSCVVCFSDMFKACKAQFYPCAASCTCTCPVDADTVCTVDSALPARFLTALVETGMLFANGVQHTIMGAPNIQAFASTDLDKDVQTVLDCEL